MHQALQYYQAHKAQMDTDYYLASLRYRTENNPQVAHLRETPEYKALIGLIQGENPFKDLLENCKSLSIEELRWLVDNMPSGWHRAHMMDELMFREKETIRLQKLARHLERHHEL